jgi:hypothetical protein
MDYRGYDLEKKPLMVGWQITITKDERFVWHGNIVNELDFAINEAHEYIDDLLSYTEAPLPLVVS